MKASNAALSAGWLQYVALSRCMAATRAARERRASPRPRLPELTVSPPRG